MDVHNWQNYQSDWLLCPLGQVNSSSSNRITSTTRCTACIIIRYRSQLRVRRHREKCHNVAHDSHTTYVCSHAERGTNGEVEELSKRKTRLLKSKCDYRDVQIKKLIKKQGVRMIDKDNEDMHRLMNRRNWLPMLRMNLTRTSPSVYAMEGAGQIQ